MKRYSLSQEADRDIEGIARETVKRWGWPQAEKYLDELHQAFETLVEFRELGRDVSYLRPGYWRLEHASHSIFYRHTADGILIVRILHNRMQAEHYL